MDTLGFDSNLVAYNCMVDRLCKAGYTNNALKIFETMEVKDSITYTTLVITSARKGDFCMHQSFCKLV